MKLVEKIVYNELKEPVTQTNVNEVVTIKNKQIKKTSIFKYLGKICHISPIFKSIQLEELDRMIVRRQISFLHQLITNSANYPISIKKQLISMEIPVEKINENDTVNITRNVNSS